jgi:hypothetical protein
VPVSLLRLLHLLSLTPPPPPLPFPTMVDALVEMVVDGTNAKTAGGRAEEQRAGYLAAMDVSLALAAVARSGTPLDSLRASLSPTLAAIAIIAGAGHGPVRSAAETTVALLAAKCTALQAARGSAAAAALWTLLAQFLSTTPVPAGARGVGTPGDLATAALASALATGPADPPLPFLLLPALHRDPLRTARILLAHRRPRLAARCLARALAFHVGNAAALSTSHGGGGGAGVGGAMLSPNDTMADDDDSNNNNNNKNDDDGSPVVPRFEDGEFERFEGKYQRFGGEFGVVGWEPVATAIAVALGDDDGAPGDDDNRAPDDSAEALHQIVGEWKRRARNAERVATA